jgi:hypothetical protein
MFLRFLKPRYDLQCTRASHKNRVDYKTVFAKILLSLFGPDDGGNSSCDMMPEDRNNGARREVHR